MKVYVRDYHGVYELRLIILRFCVFYVQVNYFPAHLMVSSKVDSKVLRKSIQIIFLIKVPNGKCYVGNFRWFLFGMSPDVLAFKVCVFTSDFKF